jgi:predicted TPR repeat methyltransferase
MTSEKSSLEQVYAASSAEELAAAYAEWSSEYDRETVGEGYCLPFIIAGWIARYVPKGGGPLLDAGCGTGLSGPYLRALGYDAIEGLDFSEKMLALARQRNAYRALKQAELGKTLPWPEGYFAAFLSTGVFTEGHAPASSLDELTRITRPGGHAIFTVRDTVLEQGGFRDVFEWLEIAERWKPVEESPLFRAFAIAEPEVLVKAFVFEVL